MNTKINDQLICIPPYISAKWEQIVILKTEVNDGNAEVLNLVLHLVNNTVIVVPNLSLSIIDLAFSSHLQFLEKSENIKKASKEAANPVKFITELIQQFSASSPQSLMKIGVPLPLVPADFESILQHDITQKDIPDASKATLSKMAGTLKTILGNDFKLLLSPEPHCNCLHCQTGKFLFQQNDCNSEEDQNDLTFRPWDIIQSDTQIYTVTNPLNPKEQYNVYLGGPVECSCGNHHCEHIKAVLYS